MLGLLQVRTFALLRLSDRTLRPFGRTYCGQSLASLKEVDGSMGSKTGGQWIDVDGLPFYVGHDRATAPRYGIPGPKAQGTRPVYDARNKRLMPPPRHA